MQKIAITASGRQKTRRIKVSALAEKQSIKCAVENIPNGAGKDKRQADNEAIAGFVTAYAVQKVGNQYYSNNAEDTQEQFAIIACKLHSESHSVVFGKVNDEPVSRNVKLLTERHVQLYPEFQRLVEEQDYKNN